MKRLDDECLAQMMVDLESYRVERKESFKGDAEKIREAVCAFANDLAGDGEPGVVFVGVRDDGTPACRAIDDQLLLSLSNIKTDGNITPPPCILVEKRHLRGADVAVITVFPSDSPPVRLRGRTMVRIGPRRGVAEPQDERILTERRRHGNRPFDVHPVRGATIADLNHTMFLNDYLPALVPREVLEGDQRSIVERMAAAKMVCSIEDPAPTNLGMLILGKSTRDFIPGAYIQFLRLHGDNLTDPVVDEARFDGPISEMVKRAEDKLESHNRASVAYADRSTEYRQATYPSGALRQIVRNAVLHRTYENSNAPIRVYWYANRIEISNPGGPFGEVTADSFGRPGVNDYRNPNLAEALRALGLVQRFASGIALANKELAANGNRPLQFEVEQGWVLARMWGNQ